MSKPDLILLFSGKRKTGKDFTVNRLINLLDKNKYQIISIQLSAPLKRIYAQENNIEYERLLDSSEFKEKYRGEMIKWGEEKRKEDYGYFCKLAVKDLNLLENKIKIFIVSDCRRKSDIKWFEENYLNKTKLVRVLATEEIRKKRNWIFKEGIDDAESECDLDNLNRWDFIINNNFDDELEKDIQILTNFIEKFY